MTRVPWTGQDGLSETSGLPYPRNATGNRRHPQPRRIGLAPSSGQVQLEWAAREIERLRDGRE